MAAVTQVTTGVYGRRHVLGDSVVIPFNVSGASGSTLNTQMQGIYFVAIQQSTAAGSI